MKKIFIILLVLVSCNPARNHFSREILGTVCSIYIPQHGSASVVKEIFNELDYIENKMSKHITESDIYKINNSNEHEEIRVSDETCFLIKESLVFSDLSEGLFDISIGPLVKAWGFGYDAMQVPQKDSLKEALNLTNYKNIIVKDNNVKLGQIGMMLDLGGIAKGFAADKAVEILKKRRISSALLDFGGNIYVYGKKPDNTDWKIGIQDPFDLHGSVVGILSASNKAIVTSGTYERFFIENGKKYHHILNPETGFPVENGLAGVTIISENATKADALSTTSFLMGLEKGMALINDIEGVDAIFIDNNKNVYLSNGISAEFRITSQEYHIKN